MTISVGRDIAVHPSVVWDLLVDTDRWSQWGPSVTAVELTGAEPDGTERGVVERPAGQRDRQRDGQPTGERDRQRSGVRRIRAGSTGRVRTALGVWVPFVVTDFEEGRSWGWRVAGVPATTHRVLAGERGCRVEFGIPTLAAPYAVVCRAALRRIELLALGDSGTGSGSGTDGQRGSPR